ncbi:MAG: LLM class flavin-dependent oxidoreductase [Chloroflexi bacterium]|nr:LLM class flavin-dependent oxidoreductase [Chloroflexota bacterium]
MAQKRIGVAAMGGDSRAVLDRIILLERMGIPAAWLTTGGTMPDGITLFAAAAARTERILLGTCITPTWPRHPLVTVQQTQVVAHLAPGRFRLGVGPSHKASMEQLYGFKYHTPLTHLREYIHIVKKLLHEGAVDFDGKHFHAHAKLATPLPDIPIMASALRSKSYELCGELADGAISWVCPGAYLRDVALPAMVTGARKAGRPTPPLIVHAPVCVHDSLQEAHAAAREQLGNYPRSFLYQQMFVAAGFPEATEGSWSDRMLDAVVLAGNEQKVGARLRQLFDWGATEIIAHPIGAGRDARASIQRTLELVAAVSRSL